MKKLRGVTVLIIAILIGLAAAKAVSFYMAGLKATVRKPQVADAPKAVRPVAFTEAIPEGMRAVSLRVDEISGVSRGIGKGDLVDVLATTSAGSSGGESITHVVLEAVRVLETSLEGAGKGNGRTKADREWTVTLLVTPEDGAVLTAASAQSRISVLARGRNDKNGADFRAVVFDRYEGLQGSGTGENDPASRLKPGMRAVTLQVRNNDGICGRLKQGDRVDIIVSDTLEAYAASSKDPGATATITGRQPHSVMLLENVEVMAVEQSEQDKTKSKRTAMVTFQLPLSDAGRVVSARDCLKGATFSLLLRSRGDRNAVAAGSEWNPLEIFPATRGISNKIPVYRGIKFTPVSVKDSEENTGKILEAGGGNNEGTKEE
jgi:Flp pilus assembly protein CpaB